MLNLVNRRIKLLIRFRKSEDDILEADDHKYHDFPIKLNWVPT